MSIDITEALIDIIIPTYKPDNGFGNLIKRLLKQTRKINKIIVINTGIEYWDDRFLELTELMEVHHITKEEFGHGLTRNKAVTYSDADIVIFMTQDAKPYNKYMLEKLVEGFAKDKDIYCAYARQLAKPDATEIERYTRIHNYPRQSCVKAKEDLPSMGIKTYFCSNSCAAYDRKEFLRLGGFDENLGFGEDTVFAAKIIENDGKIAYCGDSIVLHSHNYTLVEQFKRNFDIGVMHRDVLSKYNIPHAEGEGVKLVLNTASYLIESREYLWLIYLLFYSGAKYVGYLAGSNHNLLPKVVKKELAMNPAYFDKKKSAK